MIWINFSNYDVVGINFCLISNKILVVENLNRVKLNRFLNSKNIKYCNKVKECFE